MPDKIPYDDLTPDNPRENFTIAFEAAKYVGDLLASFPDRLLLAVYKVHTQNCLVSFPDRLLLAVYKVHTQKCLVSFPDPSKTLRVWDQTKYYLHCQQ